MVDRRIPAEARWVRYRATGKSRLAYAVVDPERANLWDWNRLNDSKVLGTGRGAAATLGHRAVAKYTGWAAALSAPCGRSSCGRSHDADSRGPVSRGIAELSHWKLVLLLALLSALLGITGASPLVPTLEADARRDARRRPLPAQRAHVRAHRLFRPARPEGPGGRRLPRRVAAGPVSWASSSRSFSPEASSSSSGRGPFGFGQLFEPARRNLWHNIKCFFLFAVACGVALGGLARRRLLSPQQALREIPAGLSRAPAELVDPRRSERSSSTRRCRSSTTSRARHAASPRPSAPGAGSASRARPSPARGSARSRSGCSGSSRAASPWLALLALAWTMPAVSPPAIFVMFVVLFAALAAALRRRAWRPGAPGSRSSSRAPAARCRPRSESATAWLRPARD